MRVQRAETSAPVICVPTAKRNTSPDAQCGHHQVQASCIVCAAGILRKRVPNEIHLSCPQNTFLFSPPLSLLPVDHSLFNHFGFKTNASPDKVTNDDETTTACRPARKCQIRCVQRSRSGIQERSSDTSIGVTLNQLQSQ